MVTIARRAVAASLLACITAVASASSSVEGGLSKLTVTLIDLDTSDGITPSLFFTHDTSAAAQAGINVHVEGWIPTAYYEREAAFRGKQPLDSLSSGDIYVPYTQAALGTSGAQNGFDYISGSGFAPTGEYVHGRLHGEGWTATTGFTLTPNTAVTFSADGAMRASTTLGANSAGTWFESAAVTLRLGVADGGMTWDYAEQALNATYLIDPMGHYTGESKTWEDTMSISFFNIGDDFAQGRLRASVNLDAQSIPLVPEPASAAMMLAGLALTVAAVRRRT